jgi:hypothetical protein
MSDDITTGEVARGLDEVKRELDSMSKDVTEIKVTLAGFTGPPRKRWTAWRRLSTAPLGWPSVASSPTSYR